MYHVIILFQALYDISTVESNQKSNVFCGHFVHTTYLFPYEGKVLKYKICFEMQPIKIHRDVATPIFWLHLFYVRDTLPYICKYVSRKKISYFRGCIGLHLGDCFEETLIIYGVIPWKRPFSRKRHTLKALPVAHVRM
jgi:hypothetical protein